jgi:hypothetical protein
MFTPLYMRMYMLQLPSKRAIALCACVSAGACLNIAACALHSPLCPGRDSPAIIWAPEGQPTATQAVSWGELQGRCMQVATAIAARFPPGMWQRTFAMWGLRWYKAKPVCESVVASMVGLHPSVSW